MRMIAFFQNGLTAFGLGKSLSRDSKGLQLGGMEKSRALDDRPARTSFGRDAHS
jgi:hypothetical protein